MTAGDGDGLNARPGRHHDHGQEVAGTMIMAGNMQYLLGSVHDHGKSSKLDTIMVPGRAAAA
jgi:hypothetical protein